MTKMLIIAILSIISLNLYSQDKEPVAWPFKYNNNANAQEFNPNDFLQTKMQFGFQWAASKNMNDALGNNCYATHGYPPYLNNSTNPLSVINQPTWWDSTGYNISAWNAPFMTYEPTLPLNGTNFGQILRPDDDINNPIFGFKERQGVISNNPQDENYSRLVLTTSLVDTEPVTVLENIEPQPKFISRTFFGEKGFMNSGQTDNYLGKKWFLTVNLRRLNYETDILDDDEILLSLKIHYKLGNTNTGDIKFKNIPMEGMANYEYLSDDEGSIQDNRGKAQLLEPAPANTSVVYIRRNMLPVYNPEYPEKDITISAEFWNHENYDPNPNSNENPMFTDLNFNPEKTLQQQLQEYLDGITEIDIEVQYYGKTDLAIDYVRIESINAHYLLRGKLDEKEPDDPNGLNGRGFTNIQTDPDHNEDEDYIEQPNDMYYIIQSCLDHMKRKSDNYDGAKLYRFYYQDTECDKFYWWGPLRYCNLVTKGMFMPRDVHAYPKIYEYYTKSRTRWIGTTYSTSDVLMPAPYLRNGKQNWETLGLKFGYIGHGSSVHYPDSLESEYETALWDRNIDNLIKVHNDDAYYFGTLINPSKIKGLQAVWEGSLYRKYFDPLRKQQYLFYSNTPWLDYFLFYNVTKEGVDPNIKITNTSYRPKTAEELRLFIWSDLLRGCKGILFDGDWNLFLPATSNGQMGIGDNSLLPTEDLYSDLVGSDFIDNNNTWNTSPYVDQSVLSEKMMIEEDRAYIGTKSIRTELWKTNQFILKNNDLLMNLRLAANYSKGFRAWYNQDDRYTSGNIMKKFLAMGFDNTPNRLKTRKLWNPEENAVQESYEDFDSSFVDVTLLRPTEDENLTDNTFIIGVQNRRTDPLVYYTSPTNPSKKYVKFLSTAEYDILTQSGGVDPDNDGIANHNAEYWQSYYWKRLGCREITIPFNYCDPSNGNDYVLLRVQELKADENDNDRANWPWWRKERYDNYIDTIIGQNSPIAVKFLPGEGKMFKVEIIRPEPSTGGLAHSNQSKFIVFPEYNGSIPSTDKVRYHLTYHKPDPSRNNVMSVYYKRSEPMQRDAGNENLQIEWEKDPLGAPIEACLSNSIILPDPFIPVTPHTDLHCEYSSMVVRRDGNYTNAYVVFQARAVLLQGGVEDQQCYPIIDESKYYMNPICETILNVGDASITYPQNPTILDAIVYGDPAIFGTPVINSSKNGNFVAWADEHCGISVGYKAIGSTNFVRTYDIKANNGIASNPSINIYSIFDKNENDCSIVWQEKNSGSSLSSIYYTKLRFGLNGLEQFLPTLINNFNPNDRFGDCLKLSDLSSSYMPTVYRLPTTGNLSSLYRHYEVIAWHTDPENAIVMKTLTTTYDFSKLEPIHRLWFNSNKKIHSKSLLGVQSSLQHDFKSPVLSQVTSYTLYNGVETLDYYASREFLLNFVDNWNNSVEYSSGSQIYHLREGMNPSNYFIEGNSAKVTEFNKNIYPVAEGTYPHLAYSQNINSESDVWKNHRVYEKGTLAGYTRIVPNPIYFQPFEECPQCKKANKYLSFSDLLVGGGFSFPFYAIDGEPNPTPLAINLPYIPMTDSIGDYLFPTGSDTIFTEWFEVDSTAELQYLVKLNDTTRVQFKLQKLSDSSFVDLPAPYLPNTGFARQVFYLVNGNYDEYRLAMVNTDTLLSYTEDLYFEPPTVIDTIYAKQSYEVKKNVVNLNKNISLNKQFNLQCMPNPANEILKVAVYSNQNIKAESVNIQIYNYQGKIVWESNSIPNSTSTIPVSDFENGIYLVRANILTENGYITETSKVVILR